MLETLLERYGYWMVFLASMAEPDAALGAAAFLAQRDRLDFWTSVAAASLGSGLISQIAYAVGRSYGRDWLDQRRTSNPRIVRVTAWIQRRGAWLIFFSRFLWGFRLLIAISCGALHMPPTRFTLLNLAGAAVWGVAVGAAGYALGGAASLIWRDVERHEIVAAGVVFVLIAALWRWRRRRLKKAAPH